MRQGVVAGQRDTRARAELRNGGDRSNLAVLWGLGQLQLEVDGKWYKSPFFLGSAFRALEPGTVLDTLVTLSPAWFEAKEEDLRLAGGPQGWL